MLLSIFHVIAIFFPSVCCCEVEYEENYLDFRFIWNWARVTSAASYFFHLYSNTAV